MSAAKHTPGPWSTKFGDEVWAGKMHVAYAHDDSRKEANAALIAAAPDLLFVAEALTESFDDDGLYSPTRATLGAKDLLDAARAAIAKARGAR